MFIHFTEASITAIVAQRGGGSSGETALPLLGFTRRPPAQTRRQREEWRPELSGEKMRRTLLFLLLQLFLLKITFKQKMQNVKVPKKLQIKHLKLIVL